ncbi:hypothetical protein NTCA1_24470 [Novosphingobium sp. TCA1]|nr:hypothetical protein NTCA1_24470 [Novosphingobium sp. TCA1]
MVRGMDNEDDAARGSRSSAGKAGRIADWLGSQGAGNLTIYMCAIVTALAAVLARISY